MKKQKLSPVVLAAVVHEGIVYTGKRHCDAIRKAYATTGRTVKGTQGFVDAEGVFLTRREAIERALATGQISKPVKLLTNEDLW